MKKLLLAFVAVVLFAFTGVASATTYDWYKPYNNTLELYGSTASSGIFGNSHNVTIYRTDGQPLTADETLGWTWGMTSANNTWQYAVQGGTRDALTVQPWMNGGVPAGTYTDTLTVNVWDASAPVVVPVKYYVQPVNVCTDGQDNDGDGGVDWNGIELAPQVPKDAGCVSMFDTSEADGDQSGGGGGTLPSRWKPAKLTTWFWEIGAQPTNWTGNINSYQYAMYDVDGVNTIAANVSSLHANGRKATCYYSAGTYEPGRPDSAQFTAADKGAAVQGWPGEYWLDTRSTNVRNIMVARMQACKNKGFDAVEPDNMDGYQNSPGFPLTATTQLDYNKFIAAQAHALGLAVFLKNDVDQLTDLQPYYDGAINEQCAQYAECGGYSVFLNANKPVLQAEYGSKNTTRCNAAQTAGRMAAYSTLNLNGTWNPCWPTTQPLDTGGTTTAGP